MKIENCGVGRGGGGISVGKKSTNILFLLKQPVCVDKLKVRKTIVIINFSVLDFFKFVSRMPQIAQILVSTFKIFQVGVGDNRGYSAGH